MALPAFLKRWRTKSHVTQTVSDNRGGWWPWIREPFAGAWQRNIEWTVDSVLAHPTVYACVTLIASDIAKMPTMLVERVGRKIWIETENPAYSPVLREPNRYQTDVQFKKNWVVSKLVRGNTYVLKERDLRGVVVALYILDPARVTVLVATDGSVFYQLGEDNLSGLRTGQVSVPASEILHDRCTPLFHPLVGVAPLYASGGPASVGLEIQRNSGAFFSNGSNPSGIITGPNMIPQPEAQRIKEHWEEQYSGANSGSVAVLGTGLSFEPMRMTSVDAQMIEHDKAIDFRICSAFRVPAFMVNVGAMPTLANAELLTRQYYSTCLQDHAVEFERVMDKGLGLTTETGNRLGIALDTAALLQMDTATMYDTLAKGVRGGFLAPNEARSMVDLLPLKGGDTIYLQHQDYPIEQVFERDDLGKEAAPPAPTPAVTPPAEEEPEVDEEQARAFFERRFETRWRQAA